jgi:ribose 5-phosphate isomerase A
LKDIRCTSTSEQTETLARSLNIPMFELPDVAPLDVAIDGADEIDAQLRLIKGRGGALLREKIVEQQAARFIVIADESKIVDRLGVGLLPVEITPFAREVLTKRFEVMGLDPVLRLRDGTTRITDEGNVILDIRIPPSRDIADVVDEVRALAGVVETGFFPTEATEAVVAGATGIRWMHRNEDF